jgi:GTP-binding protein LepA
MCEKLKDLIPRHMFKIPIQAAIGGKRHRPRDHLGDAQGRDRQVLRRRRHPQAQAARQAEEGKKRMRQFGKVEIPQEAFIAALKMDSR